MTKTFKLYWIRADEQGSLPMGAFASRAEAEASIPAAKAALLDQCAVGEGHEDEIEAGRFEIDEDEED